MSDKLGIFREWFVKGGGRFGEHIELQYDPHRNIHLRVEEGQKLQAGSCIVSCPHALTLSQFSVWEGRSSVGDDIRSFTTENATSITNLNLLRYFLIEQYHLGKQSFWWPYINLLPDPLSKCPFDTPLYYDEDDLKWFQGTSLEHSRRTLEELWKDEYAQGLQTIIQSEKHRYAWHLYKWAATVIASRSFPGSALKSTDHLREESQLEACPILLPGLDLLNHSPAAKVTWRWTSEACSIDTEAPLPGGTEILNNYAPKSNEELIMGYGFSLFKNSSDHCNITLGAKAVAYIKDITHQRRLAPPCKDPSRAKGFSRKPTMDVNLDYSGSGIGWVRLVPNSRDRSHLEPGNLRFVFAEGFLQQASIAFFNTRERQTGTPLRDAEIHSTELTRNRLHTLCAITMMLQKQYSDIIAGNVSLPPWPRNQRQFHAARYRRGQLHILRSVSDSIVASLRGIAGLTRDLPRDKRIMRLEHILVAAPKDFLRDFRAAIHVGLGTRDAEKLKQQDLAESAFIIWLCGLWLWSLPTSSFESQVPSQQNLPARTAKWLAFVRATYGDESEIGRRWSALPASEEGRLLTESHYCMVKAAAEKNPQSIYSHPEATTDRLLWCLRVIREESFVSPNLDGEVANEPDEIILFLEEDITFTEVG